LGFIRLQANYFGVLGCFKIFELDFEADFEAFEEFIVLEEGFLPLFPFEPFLWCDFFTLTNDSFKIHFLMSRSSAGISPPEKIY